MLTIAGLEMQYCRVVWRCHEFAGIEFATPLAEAVLERLLQDQQTLSETAISELRVDRQPRPCACRSRKRTTGRR